MIFGWILNVYFLYLMYKKRDNNNLNLRDMKKLVLAISLVIASSVNVFSQKNDFKKFGVNNKIMNYILKGDYQKVINITKTSYFRSIAMKDTNWVNGGFFDKQHPISEQDLIGYLSRIRDMVNASNIESAIQNPNGVTIEVTNWSANEEYFRGTPREDEMSPLVIKTYKFTKDNYTTYFIVTFEKSELYGLGIHFFKDSIN